MLRMKSGYGEILLQEWQPSFHRDWCRCRRGRRTEQRWPRGHQDRDCSSGRTSEGRRSHAGSWTRQGGLPPCVSKGTPPCGLFPDFQFPEGQGHTIPPSKLLRTRGLVSPRARNTNCAWPAAEAKPPGPWGSSPPDQEGFLAHICVFPKQRDTKISLKGSKPAVCLPVARLRQAAVGGEQSHRGDGVPGLQASLGRAGRNLVGEHCALGTGQSHPESTQRARVLKMSSRGE